MPEISDDEMNVLSTALIALVDSSACKRNKKGLFVVRCGDGRKRKFTEKQFIRLIDKLAVLAGHGSVKKEALAMAKAGGLQ